VKHTYLYPITSAELWLWRASRMDGGDLFGNPPVDAPDAEWSLCVGIADAIGAARTELHKRLETRDRICIGRHYVIPGSLDEGARARGRDADGTVRGLTELLWDAPPFLDDTYGLAYVELKATAGTGGRDEWSEIRSFLGKHVSTQENPVRLVPVWM
jgi:hypothetical protein